MPPGLPRIGLGGSNRRLPSAFLALRMTEPEFDGVMFTRQVGRYYGALAPFAVESNIDNTSAHMLWVVHLDVKSMTPELADR